MLPKPTRKVRIADISVRIPCTLALAALMSDRSHLWPARRMRLRRDIRIAAAALLVVLITWGGVFFLAHGNGPKELPREGSWRWDFPTGIVTWDEDLLEIAGIPPEMFTGRIEDIPRYFEFRDQGVVRRSIEAIQASADTLTPRGERERRLAEEVEQALSTSGPALHIRRPDGRIVQLRTTSSELIFDEKGVEVGRIGTLRRFGEIETAEQIPLTPLQPVKTAPVKEEGK